MNDFSKRLQNLLNTSGKEISDVVEQSKRLDSTGKGISKVNMSQWLSGKYKPSTDKIALLSQVFNVNPNYLMGYTDEPTYNLERLTQEAELCDLMKKCYGTDAYRIVKMYMMLNEYGKQAAFERVQELTQLDKFVKGDAEKQRMA